MALFKTREPRSSIILIYINERKRKTEGHRRRAKRELGMLPPKEFNRRYSRNFRERTKHLRRRKESGRKPMKWGVALIIIGALLFIWHYLLTGSFRF